MYDIITNEAVSRLSIGVTDFDYINEAIKAW